MVNQHYRWDFIGLSTDDKPTFASSPKVTDGSTFYESDTSKLYVWYQDQWYEKEDTGGGSSINVVQTTGDSTTDVMSQNATTGMVFADPSTRRQICIGDDSSAGNNGVAIGQSVTAHFGIGIGGGSSIINAGVAIGRGAAVQSQTNGVAIGDYSRAMQNGEMNIGSTQSSHGYNMSNYRLLTGVYDGQSAHDAATYGQLDTRLGGLTVVSLTQAEYDALSTKDANTLYVIKAS